MGKIKSDDTPLVLNEKLSFLQKLHKQTGALDTWTEENVNRVFISDDKGTALPEVIKEFKWLLELNKERNRVIKWLMEYQPNAKPVPLEEGEMKEKVKRRKEDEVWNEKNWSERTAVREFVAETEEPAIEEVPFEFTEIKWREELMGVLEAAEKPLLLQEIVAEFIKRHPAVKSKEGYERTLSKRISSALQQMYVSAEVERNVVDSDRPKTPKQFAYKPKVKKRTRRAVETPKNALNWNKNVYRIIKSYGKKGAKAPQIVGDLYKIDVFQKKPIEEVEKSLAAVLAQLFYQEKTIDRFKEEAETKRYTSRIRWFI
jgi:hypothetical protein